MKQAIANSKIESNFESELLPKVVKANLACPGGKRKAS